jgi:hypothetical protein
MLVDTGESGEAEASMPAKLRPVCAGAILAASRLGFDDVFGADFCSPPLTTLTAPIEHAGRVAVSMLLPELAAADRSPAHTPDRAGLHRAGPPGPRPEILRSLWSSHIGQGRATCTFLTKIDQFQSGTGTTGQAQNVTDHVAPTLIG